MRDPLVCFMKTNFIQCSDQWDDRNWWTENVFVANQRAGVIFCVSPGLSLFLPAKGYLKSGGPITRTLIIELTIKIDLWRNGGCKDQHHRHSTTANVAATSATITTIARNCYNHRYFVSQPTATVTVTTGINTITHDKPTVPRQLSIHYRWQRADETS